MRGRSRPACRAGALRGQARQLGPSCKLQGDQANYQAAQMVKNLSSSAGDIRDVGWITGSGRAPGGGHGNPLQYSCLENPMDRGAWQDTVHGVAEVSERT